MSSRLLVFLMAVCCVAAVTAYAEPQDAPKGKEFYTQGKELLKKADFDGAFQAFSKAAQADPKNQEYEMQAMMVRRALTLRKFAAESEVSPQWEKVIVSLHAYYLTNEVYGEAVTMNRMAHEKMNSSLSASLLAESLLEAGENDEALTLLEGLSEDKRDEQNRIYLGIALARKGRVEAAKATRKEIPVGCNTHMGQLFDLARLDTLIGNPDSACRLLTACFEQTLPSQLADVKSFANRCSDFRALLGTPAYAAALRTQSKMTESSCSGGTSCGSCPNAASCGSQPAPEPEEKGCGGCENSGSCDKSAKGVDKSSSCSGCEKK